MFNEYHSICLMYSPPGEVEGACRDGERLNYTQRIGFVTTSVS